MPGPITPPLPATGVPRLRAVQAGLIAQADRAAQACGVRLLFADLVLSPRPVLWACGDPSALARFAAALEDVPYTRLSGYSRGTLHPFGLIPGQPVTGVLHTGWHQGGRRVHGAASGIEIEFCHFLSGENAWIAARAGIENIADADTLDALETFAWQGIRLPILTGARAVWDRHPAKDGLDVVYTWVDGSDPDWQHRRAQHRSDSRIRGAADAARFAAGTELRHSVISTLRYLGDLGHIYIVTDTQVPPLGDLAQHVTIVDHREIFPDPTHLPTFNSRAIEAHLHRIPGLRQHYLYLNDDVFFGQPACAGTFFDEFGRTRHFVSDTVATPVTPIGPMENSPNAAGRNNRRLLKARFGAYIYAKFQHTPLPTDLAVMREMERALPEAWEATSANRFRSEHDHSIAGHLYAHYAALTGRGIWGEIDYAYFDLGVPDFVPAFRAAVRGDLPAVFCVNEIVATNATPVNRACLEQMLPKLYPETAKQKRPPATAAVVPPLARAARDLARGLLPAGYRRRLRSLLRRG